MKCQPEAASALLDVFFKGRANPPRQWIDASRDRLLDRFRKADALPVDAIFIDAEQLQESPRRAGWLSKWKWLAAAAAGVLVLVLSMQMPETNKALSLRQTLVVNGRITDAAGNPLPRLVVELLRIWHDDQGRKAWQYEQVMETDDLGRYRIEARSGGDYYIRARRLVETPSLETSVEVVAAYFPGTADAAAATAIALGQGSEVVADFKISNATTYKVRGKIERASNDGSLPPTQLFLVPRNPGAPWENQPQAFLVRYGEAGAGEAFELRGVPPGHYDLYVNTVRTPSASFAKASIDVRDRDLDGVQLELRPGKEVKGRVVLDGPEESFQQFQLSADTLATSPRSGQGVALGPANLSIQLDSRDGFGRQRVHNAGLNFMLTDVHEGDYDLTVSGLMLSPLSSDLYLSDVRVSGKSVLADGLKVGIDAVDALEVVISAGGGSIEGNIAQQAKQSVQLLLFPEAANRNNASLFRLLTSPEANRTGQFVLTGIAPGRYKLAAVGGGAGSIPFRDPQFLDALEPQALDLTVTRGAKQRSLVVPVVQIPVK